MQSPPRLPCAFLPTDARPDATQPHPPCGGPASSSMSYWVTDGWHQDSRDANRFTHMRIITPICRFVKSEFSLLQIERTASRGPPPPDLRKCCFWAKLGARGPVVPAALPSGKKLHECPGGTRRRPVSPAARNPRGEPQRSRTLRRTVRPHSTCPARRLDGAAATDYTDPRRGVPR